MNHNASNQNRGYVKGNRLENWVKRYQLRKVRRNADYHVTICVASDIGREGGASFLNQLQSVMVQN